MSIRMVSVYILSAGLLSILADAILLGVATSVVVYRYGQGFPTPTLGRFAVSGNWTDLLQPIRQGLVFAQKQLAEGFCFGLAQCEDRH